MKHEMEKQFLENRFVGMLFILVCAIGSLVAGLIDQETWKTTVLFAFGIFSGSKLADKAGLSISSKRDSKD